MPWLLGHKKLSLNERYHITYNIPVLHGHRSSDKVLILQGGFLQRGELKGIATLVLKTTFGMAVGLRQNSPVKEYLRAIMD